MGFALLRDEGMNKFEKIKINDDLVLYVSDINKLNDLLSNYKHYKLNLLSGDVISYEINEFVLKHLNKSNKNYSNSLNIGVYYFNDLNVSNLDETGNDFLILIGLSKPDYFRNLDEIKTPFVFFNVTVGHLEARISNDEIQPYINEKNTLYNPNVLRKFVSSYLMKKKYNASFWLFQFFLLSTLLNNYCTRLNNQQYWFFL